MYKNTDGSQKCCVEQQQKPDKKSTIIYIYLNTQKKFLGWQQYSIILFWVVVLKVHVIVKPHPTKL